jgi:hypothetical protein
MRERPGVRGERGRSRAGVTRSGTEAVNVKQREVAGLLDEVSLTPWHSMMHGGGRAADGRVEGLPRWLKIFEVRPSRGSGARRDQGQSSGWFA